MILTILVLLLPAGTFSNPSFTIGSNPYLTVFAFPHDLLRWPNQGAAMFYNPQTFPWQGDVTNISNRPSESYTNNYQSIEFAAPPDYSGNPADIRSWMELSSYAYRKHYSAAGLTTTPYGKFYVELGRTTLDLELTSEGVGRAYEEVGGVNEYHLVPFQGETKSAKDDLDFTVTYANRLFRQPFGLRLSYSNKSSDVPGGYIRFTREGETYNTPHLTWGWATIGCNHIFGYSHINTDAFYQDSYSVFAGHQLDLQASFELEGNYKSGIRYRRHREDGENYTWQYDSGSLYEGAYYIDEQWKDRRQGDMIRGYSKVRLKRIGHLDLGTLFFLQYGGHSLMQVNKVAESEPNSREREREVAIETNPFFNYQTDRGYLDFGLLLEYSRTGTRNSHTRWNSVSGSDQSDVLWSTTPYPDWSPSWESFSKGSSWFMATGFEAYSSISVYQRFALLSQLTVLRKFTRTEKIYGQSGIPDGGSSFVFEPTHQRNDYRNETWMTGSIGFSHGWGPVQAFVTLQLPLAYLIKQETSLSSRGELLFDHAKRNMWQVQEPISSRILLVYSLDGTGHPGSGHPR